jgi:GH15 family glucan-1,4-alpha-glucosidase
MTERRDRYPPIGDYAFIGNGRSVALVSRHGSIDWCCMPRMDRGSCFGRILDWDHGGHCALRPSGDGVRTTRGYLDGTLVLETRLAGASGEARVLDCFAVNVDDERGPHAQLLRVIDGDRGHLDLDVEIVPRFDYGELAPWIRYHDLGIFSAIGGDDALVIAADAELEAEKHQLGGRFTVRAGERLRLSISFVAPEDLDVRPPPALVGPELDARLQETIDWWRDWSGQGWLDGPQHAGVLRSAMVLKGLADPRTGAIAAAATTSLPEAPGGDLNRDYRSSWIRDSAFSVRSLSDVGFRREADAFRRFVERSAAGSADGLQIMYGLGGQRRLTELTLEALEGYRGAAPVRVGNAASKQLQLDAYGYLLQLAWRWHQRGHSPEDDYWRFLLDVVDAAAGNWRHPDRGIWEIRGDPRHFVHSKAMCWSALDCGIRLAEESLRQAPLERWARERDKLRRAIEREGYDRERGIFVQAFGGDQLDAALLLLPEIGFVAWDDERMVRTVDAVRDALEVDGLLLRYRVNAQLQGAPGQPEGSFLACTFWLAECLARQGRLTDAQQVFERAAACGNDLALFAEEYDPERGEMLGNFPQGLTHLSYMGAAVALAEAAGDELGRATKRPPAGGQREGPPR